MKTWLIPPDFVSPCSETSGQQVTISVIQLVLGLGHVFTCEPLKADRGLYINMQCLAHPRGSKMLGVVKSTAVKCLRPAASALCLNPAASSLLCSSLSLSLLICKMDQ